MFTTDNNFFFVSIFFLFSKKIWKAQKEQLSTFPQFQNQKLQNVEDDREVRNLIFNRLMMDVTISDYELQREAMEKFGERYPGMNLNDWRHVIEAYTPMVREATSSKTKEVSMRQYRMAAESSTEEYKE